ncbi:MAG: hypothetical protein HEP71_06600 [Roseivirga sp.]|nr:hypothetical protein [Roseivirga sp.]
MNVFKKRILPVIAGLLAGWVAIFALEAVSHIFYPPPADLDFTDKAALTAFMETLPTLAFVLLLISWMIGTFIAGMIGALVNKEAWKNSAIIIGVLLALGSIINMTLVPHPTWLIISASIAYVPSAYAGARLIAQKNSNKS